MLKYKLHIKKNVGSVSESAPEASSSVQISSVRFYQAGPTAEGTRVFPANVWNPKGKSPEGQSAENVLDDSSVTKWCDENFSANGFSDLEFEFKTPVSIIAYEVYSAKDKPLFDPAGWNLFASNVGGDDHDLWVKIDARKKVPHHEDRGALIGRFKVAEGYEAKGKELDEKAASPKPVAETGIKFVDAVKRFEALKPRHVGRYYKFVFPSPSYESYPDGDDIIRSELPTNICITLIRFFKHGDVEVMPNGAENPGGINPAGEDPGKLLDHRLTTKWTDSAFFPNHQSILIMKFDTPFVLDSYVVYSAFGNVICPTDWKLFVSNDQENWTELEERNTVSGPRGTGYAKFFVESNQFYDVPLASKAEFEEKISGELQKASSAKFYKLHFTELWGKAPTSLSLGGVRFFNGFLEIKPRILKEKGAVLEFDFAHPIYVSFYQLFSGRGGKEFSPKAWTLESSDDGVTWTVIDSHRDHKAHTDNFRLIGNFIPNSR